MGLFQKLIFGNLIGVTVFAAALLWSAHSVERAEGEVHKIIDETLPVHRALQDLRHFMLRIVSSTSEHMFLAAVSGEMEKKEGTEASQQVEKSLIEKGKTNYKSTFVKYEKLVTEYFPDEIEEMRKLRDQGDVVLSLANQIWHLTNQKASPEELFEAKEQLEVAETNFGATAKSILQHEEAEIAGRREALENAIRTNTGILIALVISAFSAIFGVGIYFSRSLIMRIHKLSNAAREVAGGKFIQIVPDDSRDELGSLSRDFSGMTDNLQLAHEQRQELIEELKSTAEELKKALAIRTRFFTAVGHDLLQPLHAARLSAGALAETNQEVDHQRLANRIEHALTTLEDLLKSILDISKLEAGAITPSLQPLPLEEIFSSLAVDIGPMARSKGLDLTWRRNAFAVISDPLMLRRILQNLLANAVQYTEQGAIMLAARRRGPDVRLEVWDTGPGIPEAERQLIFEEFQRGSAAHRPDIGGFGLGLSIVKRMADALGHPINLYSRVGRGTLFTVSVPFAADVDTRTMPNPGAGCGRPYGLAGAKVLIIDNDATVLDAMQTLLERWSCEARAVPDLAALNSAVGEGFRPEIVLADYHLNRGQCGLDAVEHLRAKVAPGLPAIVVTADHSPAIADKARAAGCDILLKPVKPAELRALMVHLLS